MNLLSITTFVLFTALVAVIAWWKTRHEDLSHSTGYYLAGRHLSWIFIAGSLILTNISTEQMVGLNGNAYADGVSVMAWEVVAVIAMVGMAWFFLPRYLARGIATIPQYIEARYGRGMRVFVSAATLFLIITGILPFVLYSGAVALEGLFHVQDLLGLSYIWTIMVLVLLIGLLGGAYSILGGLKAVAVSDTINGVGLLTGGLLIPFLGLIALGEAGSASGAVSGGGVASGGGALTNLWAGIHTLLTVHPERLSPLPDRGNPSAVPFSTLFTGMLLINVSYWCMSQFIVQRTFGARSMKDAQKGMLLAGGLKLVGILMLVVPGLIAWHLWPNLENRDLAYGTLVNHVLPPWLTGFFGAVLLGAILSSFNSALHSASTLFGLDIYQGAIRRHASDAEAVAAGKLVGLVLMFIAIGTAPLISLSGQGLFATMKIIGSAIATPMAAVVFAGIFLRFISTRSALCILPIGIAIQSYFVVYKQGADLLPWTGAEIDIHWLHITFANFLCLLGLMTLLSKTVWPPTRPMPQNPPAVIDMTWSRAAIPAGILLILVVIVLYATLAAVGEGWFAAG